ncbi:MAG: hypothetical protein RRA94_13825, partial [Bacteroidota bacterium]|nr:hypothetical protein [Bacteroidota bacterium]
MDERLTLLRREQRWIYAAATVLFLLALVFAARAYFLQNIARDWETLRSEVDAGEAALITRKLDQLVVQVTGRSDQLLNAGTEELLTADRQPRQRAAISTRMLAEFPSENWSFELRDPTGTLIAFAGEPMTAAPPGVSPDRFSILQRTPYILLTRHSDILDDRGRHIGSLRVGTPLTTVVPINHRFLNSEGFIPALSRELDVGLGFHRDVPVSKRDGQLALPFVAGKDTLGFVTYNAADLEGYLSQIRVQFDRVLSFLLFCGIVIVSVPLFRTYGSLPRPALGIAAAVLHIWAVRMLLQWTGFAEIMLPAPFLDPAYFASTFAGGLARSPGPLLLSVIAVMLSAASLYRAALADRDRPVSRVAAWTVTALIFLSLPLLLRGFAAALRSFVVDSQFNYDNVAGLLSQPMFLTMIINAYLLSLALGFALLSMYLFIKRAWAHVPALDRRGPVLLVGGATGMLLLFATTRDLLLPVWAYILFLIVFIVPQLVRVPLIRGRSESLLAPFAVSVLLGGLLTVGLFSHFMEDKRFSEIEAIAIDLSRPVDGWSQVLLEQTLQYISRTDIADIPEGGRDGRLDYQAAFRLWSGSPLSRLQNNSAILLLDSTRTPVSRFAVGNDPFLLSMHTLAATIESTEGIVQSAYHWQETRGRRYYKAYTDVSMRDAGPLLAVVILETPDPMQVRRQAVDLLRSAPVKRGLAPEDDYIISRFRNGR